MNANNCTKYKFRAECAADAQVVRAVVHPWLNYWQETSGSINHEGKLHAIPDVNVEFGIGEGGPTYGEILWMVDGICNCHVVGDTLASVDSYTGERKFRGEFELPAQPPGKEILLQAIYAIQTRQQVMEWELERSLQHHRICNAAFRLGDKWQPPHADEPSPGWLVPVRRRMPCIGTSLQKSPHNSRNIFFMQRALSNK